MALPPIEVPLSGHRSAGNLVFVSGQLGHQDGVPFDSLDAQIRAAVAALGDELQAAGATYADVLRTTVYLTDRSNFARMNELYAELFPNPYPARTTVVVDLAAEGFLFEIDAIASIPGDHGSHEGA